ncbi:MAG: response regulator transcription factor [Chloroflexi bacterium]|nr:response regulator transcription factor [Chloroflexota bacterium]
MPAEPLSDHKPVRILIADDHALFREGVNSLLLASPDIISIGQASSGQEAVALTLSLAPDIVLMDVHMPDLNGIEATRRILAARPETGIVVLTMLEDDATVFGAMRAGARGYVLKGSHHQDLLLAIRAVAAGQVIFGPGVAARMLNYFESLHGAFFGAAKPESAFPELTARELDVLRLIAQGQNNSEIAGQLVISPRTVRNHITSIFSKLQVADRAQAVVRARQAGLGQDRKVSG